MLDIDLDKHCVRPGDKPDLSSLPSKVRGGLDKTRARTRTRELQHRLAELQERLYAEGEHAVLVVLQAMDAAGKDSTIRRCFGPINPQGCRTTSFKTPTGEELRHDFLWRVHRETPARGMIGVFNRSHYEDVLIARVKELAPGKVWKKRYTHINAFEKLLVDEGTTILKYYLHVSKDYQRKRLQRRLEKPEKHWKFDPEDLAKRGRWAAYMAAYEEVFARCSKPRAPWYIVPAERRWYRDLFITQTLVQALEGLHLQRPEPDFDPREIQIE